jgi:SAM-dependent methyltransferase
MRRPFRKRRITWQEGGEFELGDRRFVCSPIGFRKTTRKQFCLAKTPEMIDGYVDLLEREQPQRIFEVGIFRGGSTALFAELARPEKLVAIDIEPHPIAPLASFIDERGLASSVTTRWGVDQSDVTQLREIAATEFDNSPLDLVIDDASHELEPSRRTFDALFPLLRPGGTYLLEDWSWAHLNGLDVWTQKPPLTLLVFELVIASSFHPELIERVEVDRMQALIRRGRGEITESERFSLARLVGERGEQMLSRIGS